MGEDLYFIDDGYVYMTSHFVLETGPSCEPFKTFQIAYHGKICPLKNSDFISNTIVKSSNIKIKESTFINYSETFLDMSHNSNLGFEGNDFNCEGRKVEFDDYYDINILSNTDFEIVLVSTNQSYSLIRFDLRNPLKSGEKVGFRIGFLFEPINGRVKRFSFYPPEVNHYFHFYTMSELEHEVIQFLQDMHSKNKIMDVRLESPIRRLPTCDFYLSAMDGIIESMGLPSKNNRMPYSKEDFASKGFFNHHLYPKEMMQKKKEITYMSRGGEEVNAVQVIDFGKNSPYLLQIKRVDNAIFYSIIPSFISILGLSIALNTEYLLHITPKNILLISLVLTVLLTKLLVKVFTKTKV